jgi:triosephosphate isomerase
MPRTPLIVGNWKMNLNHVEAVGLVQKLAWTLDDKRHDPKKSEVVVLPPFTDLRTVQTMVEGDRLTLGYGAQDVSQYENGAHTGEVSADMLAKLNCRYVTVGHSERRQFNGETDEVVNRKAAMALSRGLTPIVCVGEGLEVRREEFHVPFTLNHVDQATSGLSAEQVASLVIAYEPVWAIGTGEVATPEDAQEVCGAIRGWLADTHGQEVAEQVRVLYGGSVKPDNAPAIMAQPDIDGCLVGGASLVVDDFAGIARFYELPVR